VVLVRKPSTSVDHDAHRVGVPGRDRIADSEREDCQARALLEVHILADSVSASRQCRQPRHLDAALAFVVLSASVVNAADGRR